MQVFGQHYPVVNMKRVARPHRAHDAAQKIDLPCERIIAAPLRQIDGKEISSACMPGAMIVGHSNKYCGRSHAAQCAALIAPYGL